MENQTISIVVQDLEPTGGISDDDLETANEYLRGRIGELPNYQVIDQGRVRELMEINEMQQLSGIFDMEGNPEQIAMIGAEQVILGSVGLLFDRVVISVRLVELVTGEIVFSYTSHANESDIFLRLDEIVQRIREYGLLRYQTIRVSDIAELTDRGRYAEAQERLEGYIRQQRRNNEPVVDSPEFGALQQEINENLYEDYLKQARRARRRDDFEEARRTITRAIALQPSSEALEERDRIRLAQEEYQREIERRQRMIELRAEERQQQEEAGIYLNRWEALAAFLATVETRPHRLSVSRAIPVEDELTPPTTVDSWGVMYSKTVVLRPELRDEDPRMLEAFGIGRIGINLDYDARPEGNRITVRGAVAPLSALTTHVLNVLISVGVDGGAMLRYNADSGTEWEMSPTVGTFAIGDLMLLRNLGGHLGLRVDYQFMPGDEESSPFLVTVFSGVSL